MSERMNLTNVLDHIDDKAEGEKLTVGEMLNAFGSRGYGPILLAIAIIELLPTGAIPGVPTLLAILVVFIAGQLVMGRASPWVPKRLAAKGFDKSKFQRARDKTRGFTQTLDKALKPRLTRLSSSFSARLIGGVCLILALTMPPLEVLPFASSIPSLAIGLFGVGLSADDGLIILIGLIVAGGAGVAALYWLMF